MCAISTLNVSNVLFYYLTFDDRFSGTLMDCCLTIDNFYLFFLHARIQKFSSGGVQVSLTKKALTSVVYFSPQLILQKSNGQFQRNLSFFKVQEGVQHFPGGGVQLIQGGPIAYSL